MISVKNIILAVSVLMAGVVYSTEKMKGISFVGASSPISKEDVAPIINVNANWVTLMPYGYVGNDGRVNFNTKWQWWGEKKTGVEQTILLCKNAGLKIMLKPQIWMMNAYTGDYKLATNKEWERFESSYEDFIMSFLELAIKHDIELFCIGTEWREFVAARPDFWNNLIYKAKSTYSGKLIYAANWDDYKAVPFWNQLDYIGVNGYFPISLSANPTLSELTKGWEIHRSTLKAIAEENKREIIFTEIGYRSMEGATIKPWEHHTKAKYSEVIQSRAYKAFFNVIWKESWFKGMFIWKWYHNHSSQGGRGNLDFTPQNKIAEETIRHFWANDQ